MDAAGSLYETSNHANTLPGISTRVEPITIRQSQRKINYHPEPKIIMKANVKEAEAIRWVMKTLWSLVVRSRDQDIDLEKHIPPTAVTTLVLKRLWSFMVRSRDAEFDLDTQVPPTSPVTVTLQKLWSFMVRSRGEDIDLDSQAPPISTATLATIYALKTFGDLLVRTREETFDEGPEVLPPLGFVSRITLWTLRGLQSLFDSGDAFVEEERVDEQSSESDYECELAGDTLKSKQDVEISDPLKELYGNLRTPTPQSEVSNSIKDEPLVQSYLYKKPNRASIKNKALDVKIQVMERERQKFLLALDKNKKELTEIEQKIAELNNKRLLFHHDSSPVD